MPSDLGGCSPVSGQSGTANDSASDVVGYSRADQPNDSCRCHAVGDLIDHSFDGFGVIAAAF